MLRCVYVISQKIVLLLVLGLCYKTNKDSKTVMRVLPVFSKPVITANDNGMKPEGTEQGPFGLCGSRPQVSAK